MPYRFATERCDHSALASGQVLYSAPGFPAFPVRLASEIVQRCFASLAAAGVPAPYTLYDPCCGSAHLVTALAFLHGDRLAAVIASDIDPRAVRLAERNLGLLTLGGMDERIVEIETLIERFGKVSHGETLAHAATLRRQVVAPTIIAALRTRVFRADAGNGGALRANLGAERIDLVVTDVPYGRQTTWQSVTGQREDTPNTSQALTALHPLLWAHAIVAIAANRQQVIRHPAYRRIDALRIGKRQIILLAPSRK